MKKYSYDSNNRKKRKKKKNILTMQATCIQVEKPKGEISETP